MFRLPEVDVLIRFIEGLSGGLRSLCFVVPCPQLVFVTFRQSPKPKTLNPELRFSDCETEKGSFNKKP